jgi:hypothetical protein
MRELCHRRPFEPFGDCRRRSHGGRRADVDARASIVLADLMHERSVDEIERIRREALAIFDDGRIAEARRAG